MQNGLLKLAASYARKSDPNDQGIDDQHKINAARAERDGYTIPDSPDFRFGDDDTRGQTKTRPDLDRLKSVVDGDLTPTPFTRCYCKDFTRFGRWTDPRRKAAEEVWFEDRGVFIRYSNQNAQPEGYDSSNPGDTAHFISGQVDSVRAAAEAAQTLERTLGNRRLRASEGFWVCGDRTPFGTVRMVVDSRTRTPLKVVTERAVFRQKHERLVLAWAEDGSLDVVRDIFSRCERGESMQSIADALSAAGIPGPLARFANADPQYAPWYPTAISKILRSPVYKGDYVWGTDAVRRGAKAVDAALVKEPNKETGPMVRHGHLTDPPVSAAQWDAVQVILAGNVAAYGRRKSRPENLLTGRLRCALCGAPIYGVTTTYQAKGLAVDNRYYRHEKRREAGRCVHAGKTVRAQMLEEALLAIVTNLLNSKELTALVGAALSARGSLSHKRDTASDADTLRSTRADLLVAQSNAARLAAAAKGSAVPGYAKVVEDISAEIDGIDAKLALIDAATVVTQRAANSLTTSLAVADRLSQSFRVASPELRKRIVGEVIEGAKFDYDSGLFEIQARTPSAGCRVA